MPPYFSINYTVQRLVLSLSPIGYLHWFWYKLEPPSFFFFSHSLANTPPGNYTETDVTSSSATRNCQQGLHDWHNFTCHTEHITAITHTHTSTFTFHFCTVGQHTGVAITQNNAHLMHFATLSKMIGPKHWSFSTLFSPSSCIIAIRICYRLTWLKTTLIINIIIHLFTPPLYCVHKHILSLSFVPVITDVPAKHVQIRPFKPSTLGSTTTDITPLLM